MSSEHPMTLKGREALQKELDKLIREDREQVKLAIAEARALGDLKENAEYAAAKERQSLLEGRIMEIQAMLAKARVIDPSKIKSDKIVFGATVTLNDIEKDKTVIYQIVGTDESDTKNGKISFESPIAKSLIGKEAGDTIVVRAPKGNIEYEIIDFLFE